MVTLKDLVNRAIVLEERARKKWIEYRNKEKKQL